MQFISSIIGTPERELHAIMNVTLWGVASLQTLRPVPRFEQQN